MKELLKEAREAFVAAVILAFVLIGVLYVLGKGALAAWYLFLR